MKMKRTVKIFFKDGTDTIFKTEETWLSDIFDDIKQTIDLKCAYILQNNTDEGYQHTLILPSNNIKYIEVLDNRNNSEKEHENGED